MGSAEDTAHTFAAEDFGFADEDAGDALESVTIVTAVETRATLELDGTDGDGGPGRRAAEIDAWAS